MELELYLDMDSEMITKVFCIIFFIVFSVAAFRSIVAVEKQNKKKQIRRNHNDNRGNQKRSSKTNVH